MPLDATASVMAPALQVVNLGKSYRANRALDDVSFAVPPASLTVLLGPAGAGKTTTLRIIAGLETPDAGSVLMHGVDVGDREPRARDIAMIFDNLALYPNRTGFQNLAYPLELRRLSKEAVETRVREIAGTLRIGHVLNRLPKTMSGGERQRVALGRALVREPGLFLLDEPLSSLDALLRVELRAELRRLQNEHGYSFLMATPDYAEALAVADSVVLLRAGQVVQIGDPQALYDAPIDREAARFIGAPQINLVEAAFEPADGGRLHLAGGTVAAPLPLREALAKHDGPIEVGLRPEVITLTDPAAAQLCASLIDIEPLGLKSTLTVRAEAADLRFVVEARVSRGLTLGGTVGLAIESERLLAFDRATGRRIA